MCAAHHLELDPTHLAGNDGLGRTVLLPGSANRARKIGDRLDDHQVIENRRGLTAHLGTLSTPEGPIAVAAVPTGMGCPSVDIVVNELLTLGARRLLRVGTAGSLQPPIEVGHLVIGTGAVRDQSTSDAYTPRGYPALADPWWVQALCAAATAHGLAESVHVGVLHTKDAFFGREHAQGPDAERNAAYMQRLTRMGVLASEMEAAHLFVLASSLQRGPTTVRAATSHTAAVRAGAVCAVIGTPEAGIAPRVDEERAEQRLIDVALGAVAELWRAERG